MNFQDLHNIESAQFYLDQAFKKSKKHAASVYLKSSGEQLSRVVRTESEKLRDFTKTLTEYMDSIVKKFPNIDNLPEFYMELVRLTVDYDTLKKSLGALKWASTKLYDLSKIYSKKLHMCYEKGDVNKVMKEFYGRASSVMNQIDKSLKYIEESRKVMKNFPTLKTDMFTIAITGFPNIGKSTLLSKLTPAKPEIKDYAFTTKQLNQGYANYDLRKVQFIDTPGVLDRDKMNNIELQAYLALRYVVNLIIYVIDLTEPYPLKKQEELLKKLKDYDKPMIIYLSKTDIIDKKIYDKAKKKYKAVTNLDDLNKKIEKQIKEYYFE